MAVDEVLLREVTRPLLRVYRWDRPCVSIGYFQKVSEAGLDSDSERGGAWRVVRRWTGGGRVLHGEDFTYSLMVPAVALGGHLTPRESYRRIHERLCEGLGEAGHAADVVGALGDGVALPGDCFRRPVAWDVMAEGRKVAGAAQRRTRQGLLHQGSVQGLPLARDFGMLLARQFCRAPRARADALDGLGGVTERLVRDRYGTREWLHRVE